MADMVKNSFLAWMHEERYHTRIEGYKSYDNYYNGDHDVNIPEKVLAALESELGTVLNMCRLVVDMPVDYIVGGEVGVEAKEAPEAEALLNEVYESNHLFYEEMLKLVTIMCKKGDVFLKLYIQDEEIKVRVLRPDTVFPRYKTDDYMDMMYCVVKWAEEDEDDPKIMKWHAQVFRPDSVEFWELASEQETEHTQWVFKRSEPNVLEFIPIVHVKNTVDDFEFGISDLQVMLSLQDALNKTITDMMLTMDYTAFQRVFAFGVSTPRGEQLTMEPGKITEVPTAEGHLDTVPPGEISPFIQALKEIKNQIITVTQISKLSLVEPEVSHPASGFALKVRAMPLERKCGKKMVVLKNRFAELNQMIFKAAKYLKMGDYVGVKTKLHFTGGLPTDEQTQMATHEMELRTRIKSKRTIMEERGIEDVDAEIEQIDIETNKEMEQLMAVKEHEIATEAKYSPKTTTR